MSDILFKEVRYDLQSLISFVELGEIGLPDIQRPFVWKNIKVRDLFDSIYQGFPVGYLLLWQNAVREDTRYIGTDHKQKVSRLLIVDGQQRITSLYAVIKGIPVVRENYNSETIEIAFNPILRKFEVADAAIRRDSRYIPNISSLWGNDADLFEVVDDYLTNLSITKDISKEEKKDIRKAITRLHGLLSFPFTALELATEVTEEQVAEVFVRINSQGKSLNQADFILTLMSVFWDEGRTQLEHFCRDARKPSTGTPSPFNPYIKPSPDQLLRVGVELGFKRARLQYVYSILRGKDLETEQFSDERRDQQFGVLQKAQSRVLNLQYWHDFFAVLRQAGYRSERMISSQTNLMFTYSLYLIGRTEYQVDEFVLRRVLARWFFMSSLTGRMTGSPESDKEFDLARLRNVNDGQDFVATLARVCEDTLTRDFWDITLPTELATSSPRSPSLYAYYAALNLHESRVLFSNQKVSELLEVAHQGPRSAVERHHLFPKQYLSSMGITNTRDTNQIANYALVEWGDNSAIGKTPPAEYLPHYLERFDATELERMYYWHALPDDWEAMDYSIFLVQRRERIARVISEGYKKLVDPHDAGGTSVPSVDNIVETGETTNVEFKSTLRINIHTGDKDSRMEMSCLKTIAGFLNTMGGTLIIGVADDGSSVGIEADQFSSEDKMYLHLVNLIKDRMSPQHMAYIHPRFEEYRYQRVMTVECWRARSPVYLKDGNIERFFLRTGAATTELSASQIQAYITDHF